MKIKQFFKLKSVKNIYFLFLIASINFIEAQEVHVYKSGGSYNTVSAALQAVPNGGTIIVHEGVYYENVQINNLQATANNPLVIKANPGDHVVFDGTDTIDVNWSTYSGNNNILESEPISRHIWQLFVNSTMQINARWPNADNPFDEFDNSNWWDRHESWCKAVKEQSGFEEVGGVKRGWLTENGRQNMAATGIDFNGKIAVLNVNSMESYSGFIKNHEVGSNYFEYQLHQSVYNGLNASNVATIHKNRSHAYFFFENGLDLLDVPGEWYYDKDTKKIYVYPLNGINLSSAVIRGKSQSFAFEVTNSKYVYLKDINFYATTASFIDCKNSKIEDCVMEYASYSRRILDDIDVIPHTQMKMNDVDKNNPLASPTQNLFINNEVFNTDGMALEMTKGVHDTIINNYFHKIDISGTQGGSIGVDYRKGYYSAFIRNTFEKGGGSAATKSSNFPYNKLNRLSQWGYIQDDGVAFQVAGGGQIGSISTQNWIHNTVKAGLRFDGPEDTDPYIQGKMIQGTFVRNVVWDNPLGYMVKGDDHRVYNNVAFNNNSTGAKILASTSHSHANTLTVTRNNLMEDMSGARDGDQFTDPVPGIVDHNWLSNPSENSAFKVLRDPYNLDFRPKSDLLIDQGVDIVEEVFNNPNLSTQTGAINPDFTSEFKVGNAPDIGAYEANASMYWIPGRQEYKASTAIPPNNSITVQTDADLMWLPAYKSTSSKVYFGTSTGSMQLVANQENNIHYLENLTPGQDYYWRVDCLVGANWVTGDVWTFRPDGQPYKECGKQVSFIDEFSTPLGDEDYNSPTWKPGSDMLGEVHLLSDQLLIQPNVSQADLDVNGGHVYNINGMRTQINTKVRNYPFIKINFQTPDRTEDFSFAIQVIENNNKSARSVAKVNMPASPASFTNQIISIQPMIDKWDSKNDANTWNSLKELNITINPEGTWVAADDGDLIIEDFKVGFAAIKDDINNPIIGGQVEVEVEVDGSLSLDHDLLNIIVQFQGDDYEIPKCESLLDNWEFIVKDGIGYERSGTVISPNTSENYIYVPVVLNVGGVETDEFMLEVKINQTLSIADIVGDEYKIYPNPSSGIVHIKGTTQIERVELFDVQGRQVMSENMESNRLDIAHYPTGFYFIKIFSKDGNVWQNKLLKH